MTRILVVSPGQARARATRAVAGLGGWTVAPGRDTWFPTREVAEAHARELEALPRLEGADHVVVGGRAWLRTPEGVRADCVLYSVLDPAAVLSRPGRVYTGAYLLMWLEPGGRVMLPALVPAPASPSRLGLHGGPWRTESEARAAALTALGVRPRRAGASVELREVTRRTWALERLAGVVGKASALAPATRGEEGAPVLPPETPAWRRSEAGDDPGLTALLASALRDRDLDQVAALLSSLTVGFVYRADVEGALLRLGRLDLMTGQK